MIMRFPRVLRTALASAAGVLCVSSALSAQISVGFDDLTPLQSVPSTYGGVIWGVGQGGFGGHTGQETVITAADGGFPKSAPNCVVNEWGVTQLMIHFTAGHVNFQGAYFSRYGSVQSFWAPLVGFVGFRTEDDPNPYLIAMQLGPRPTFLAANFPDVVKVQITAAAGPNGSGGWYSMDDLTYTPVPEPAGWLTLLWAAVPGAWLLKHRPVRQ